MFQKVLIANRGEIARRIIRTCKRLGIYTVAVYSEADQHALHVQEADSAYPIGGAKVSESYLNMEAIIRAAKQTNTDAIHPGYGLLSENAAFAERCRSEGIAFIGPSAQVIQRMGNKIEARKTMAQAGIPIVPGVSAPLHDAEEGVSQAQSLGYPIMLKASSGGGGIGMQLVQNDEELYRAFEGNQKERKAFSTMGRCIWKRSLKTRVTLKFRSFLIPSAMGSTYLSATVHSSEDIKKSLKKHQPPVSMNR